MQHHILEQCSVHPWESQFDSSAAFRGRGCVPTRCLSPPGLLQIGMFHLESEQTPNLYITWSCLVSWIRNNYAKQTISMQHHDYDILNTDKFICDLETRPLQRSVYQHFKRPVWSSSQHSMEQSDWFFVNHYSSLWSRSFEIAFTGCRVQHCVWQPSIVWHRRLYLWSPYPRGH